MHAPYRDESRSIRSNRIVKMTTVSKSGLFQKTMITSIVGLCFGQFSYALEALSDEHMGETTGEGIAFIPQDHYLIYRGAGPNESKSVLFSDRSKDTGYFHFLPVGPLSEIALDTNKDGVVDGKDHSVGKADLYLYGLALSKSDNDSNSRLAKSEAAAMIRSWGTADNPWIINVKTETNVPNFSNKACIGSNDASCQMSYFGLEAPLYEVGKRDPLGEDAYKLKLAMWADAFVLDQNKTQDSPQLYHLGEKMGTSDASRANRLRLQAIWNNFSINGSRLQVFQTLGGATNTDGMSVFYNNTLGIAALLRLNSGDSEGLRWGTGTPNILRLSTREIGNTDHLHSPAIQGGTAPIFAAADGLVLHNLNANVVLGALYQPLVISSDGRNFSLEVARIPNKAEIYKKIYIDYENSKPNEKFQGSVCNVYQCGSNGSAKYQGNNATHSSITLGSTVYDAQKNKLTAYTGADALGVSFGVPNVSQSATNLGSGVIDGVLIQHLKITTKGL